MGKILLEDGLSLLLESGEFLLEENMLIKNLNTHFTNALGMLGNEMLLGKQTFFPDASLGGRPG